MLQFICMWTCSACRSATSPVGEPQQRRLLRRHLHALQGTEKVVLIQEQLSKNRIIVDIDNHGQVQSQRWTPWSATWYQIVDNAE